MSDPSHYHGDGSSSRSYHGWSNETYTSHQHIQSGADESEAEAAAVLLDPAPRATKPKPKRLKIGPWDEDEIQKLIYLKEEMGMKFRDIGLEIGRTSSQCNSQYGNVTKGLSRKHKPTQTNDHGGNVSNDTVSAMGAQPVNSQQQQQPSSSSETSGSSAWFPPGMKQGRIYRSPGGINPFRQNPEGPIDWDMYGLRELMIGHGSRIDRAVYYNRCDPEKAWDAVAVQYDKYLDLEVEGEELRQRWDGRKEGWPRRLNDAAGESHDT